MYSGNNIDFSFEYAVSIIITLFVMTMVTRRNPNISSIIIIISGLIIAYISLLIINFLFPRINEVAKNVWQYFVYSIMTSFNSIGFYHVWPPILAVFIIFVVLLYNRALG